ncbi:MAG: S1C family serine protease [Thaumarchaeota archaeon]|nr:S1C family serine protease [Nitrososphaerota archaeon]
MNETNAIELLQSLSDAVAQLAEKVSPSVATVGAGRRAGSGIVWSSDGHILTANHVLGRLTSVTVRLNDGRTFESKIVGRDHYSDVALLKIEAENLTPIQQGNSASLRTGQFVLAMANPMGQKASATSGIVTSYARSIQGWWGVMMENAVVTDARLNPGYSGGPLVDASGKLVGMNVAYFSSRGIAVSVDTLKEVLGKLSRDGKVKKGFLGIVTDSIDLPDEISKKPEIGQEEGLLVLSVEQGSPARNAGVTLGDIIVKLGDKPVASLYDLHRALRETQIGKATSLWVLRGEKLTELKVTPSETEE